MDLSTHKTVRDHKHKAIDSSSCNEHAVYISENTELEYLCPFSPDFFFSEKSLNELFLLQNQITRAQNILWAFTTVQ